MEVILQVEEGGYLLLLFFMINNFGIFLGGIWKLMMGSTS